MNNILAWGKRGLNFVAGSCEPGQSGVIFLRV